MVDCNCKYVFMRNDCMGRSHIEEKSQLYITYLHYYSINLKIGIDDPSSYSQLLSNTRYYANIEWFSYF